MLFLQVCSYMLALYIAVPCLSAILLLRHRNTGFSILVGQRNFKCLKLRNNNNQESARSHVMLLLAI